MDPLIARSFYKYRYSPVYRLANDIHMNIMEHLHEDEASLLVLRLVSRSFCRIFAYSAFRQH